MPSYHQLLQMQRAILCLAMTCLLSPGVLGQHTPATMAEKPPSPLRTADQKSWKVKEKAEAVAQAQRAVGLSLGAGAEEGAEIVKLNDDNTPFLRTQLVGIPLWKITIHDQVVPVPSVPAEYQSKRPLTFDVYIDPVDGRVLMLKSRPQNLVKALPEPTAVVSEAWLRASEERWHGFPEVLPEVSFVGALDSIGRSGIWALNAEQIIAHYVVWSTCYGKHRSPRTIWAIKLRGHAPLLPPHDARDTGPYDTYYYVDAQSGKLLCATTAPRHDYEADKDYEAGMGEQ